MLPDVFFFMGTLSALQVSESESFLKIMQTRVKVSKMELFLPYVPIEHSYFYLCVMPFNAFCDVSNVCKFLDDRSVDITSWQTRALDTFLINELATI